MAQTEIKTADSVKAAIAVVFIWLASLTLALLVIEYRQYQSRERLTARESKPTPRYDLKPMRVFPIDAETFANLPPCRPLTPLTERDYWWIIQGRYDDVIRQRQQGMTGTHFFCYQGVIYAGVPVVAQEALGKEQRKGKNDHD
jgi:hypothetical protein